jgi:NAD(P)-dependent dehydrogenase (short-subunit alcohol dehydrogenase family)
MHLANHTLQKSPIDYDDEAVLGHFDDESKFPGVHRYADSKLATAAYVRRLAALAPTQVIVNHLCPGPVRTGLGRDFGLALRVFVTVFKRLAGRSLQNGGRAVVFAAAVAGPETNGKFLANNKVHP